MADRWKRVSPEVSAWGEAWFALGFDNSAEVHESRRALWRELDAMCWRNGEWIRSAYDAEVVTENGFFLARMEDDLPKARDLLLRFFAHPGLDSEEFEDLIWSWRLWEIVLDHFIGNEEETTDRLLEPVRDGSHTADYRDNVRRMISSTLDHVKHEEIHPATRRLVVELLAVSPGYKRASKKAETVPTHVELSYLLLG